MRRTVSRYIAGIFASLFLVFALSASQPMPVCAATGDCSSENTELECNDDKTVCCTVTVDESEICDCHVVS